MLDLRSQDQCEACQLPSSAEGPLVAQLLDRISELEDENANLRKFEETIHRNIHLFDALLRGSHEAILLLSPALTIVRLVHSTLGYAEEDLLGESVLGFIHPDDAHLLEDCCANFLQGARQTGFLELRGLGVEGNWIWLQGQMTDMLDDPDVQAIVLNLGRVSRADEPAR